MPVLACNARLSPLQIFTVPEGVMVAGGSGFTVTLIPLEIAELPQLFTTLKVYVPVVLAI